MRPRARAFSRRWCCRWYMVGEETGELTAPARRRCPAYYQREVDYRLRNLTAMLEPLLIIGVGGMVLILALGVFLPMWNMIGKVGHGI